MADDLPRTSKGEPADQAGQPVRERDRMENFGVKPGRKPADRRTRMREAGDDLGGGTYASPLGPRQQKRSSADILRDDQAAHAEIEGRDRQQSEDERAMANRQPGETDDPRTASDGISQAAKDTLSKGTGGLY